MYCPHLNSKDDSGVSSRNPHPNAYFCTFEGKISRFQSLAHLSNKMAFIVDFSLVIGQFPTDDGLFELPHFAYFSRLSLSLTSVKP